MTCDIILKNLRVVLGDRIILHDVNLELKKSITCVMGPNGAGKTTLLKTLSGAVGIKAGVVRVCGLNPSEAKHLISFVPNTIYHEPLVRVEDVMRVYTYGARSVMSYDEALNLVGLPEYILRRDFTELSSGEQKLVLIASALTRNPKVLLVDEPFSHLDIANQVKIADLLVKLSRDRGTLIVYTAHEPHHGFIAEEVVLLQAGRVIARGEPSKTLKASLLKSIYNVDFIEINEIPVASFFLRGNRRFDKTAG